MGRIRIIPRWCLAFGVFLAGWGADLEIAMAEAVNWGKNYQSLRLQRPDLIKDGGPVIAVTRGTMISCYDCHKVVQ
jgi:hypothetical protein